MDDFEYSVEISDRDWECFFAECEACNLLPPSLARGDESGMSEVDDTGSMLAQRVQKADLTASFSEADSPPDCGGSPVEHYLSKHGVGGMESILSGSEEDIHLQSVNIFFEKLKNVTEAEKLVEPCQMRAGKNRVVEAERCRDGQQSSGSNYCFTTRPVDTISNMNTMKKVEHISPDAAAANNLSYPETELFIREEKHTDARVNEATQWNVHSETTPHTDSVTKEQTCLLPSSDERITSSPCNVEMVTNAKWKEDQNLLFQSDAINTNKPASQQPSPSASVKRKRRKKRRLSSEPPESAHGYERRTFVRPSDSEEEQYAGRAATALRLYDNVNLLCLSEPHKNVVPIYSGMTGLPVSKHINANDPPRTVPAFDSQQQYVSENFHRQGVNNTTNDKSVHPLSPSDDNVVSAPNNNGNVATNSQPCIRFHVEELTRINNQSLSPGSLTRRVTGASDVDGTCERKDNHADCLQQSDRVNLSKQYQTCCPAEVTSITHTVSPSAASDDPAVGPSQNDNLSDAKSVLTVEAGHSIGDNRTLCQREAESQQQLETDCQETNQCCSARDLDTKPLQFKTTVSSVSVEEISSAVTGAKALDCINSSPDKGHLSERACTLNIDTVQQTGGHQEAETLSKLHHLAETHSLVNNNTDPAGEISLTGSGQRQMSTTKDMSTCPSDITPVREPQKTPDSKPSVFAMSSFWSEMEKLTINDILGLRMVSQAAPPVSLPALRESQENDMFAESDSDFFTQLNVSRSQQTNEYVPGGPESVQSGSGTVMALGSSSSRSVMWESEPVPMGQSDNIYPENMMLISAGSQPDLHGSAQKSLRRISKNVSVHNLHALESESFSSAGKGQTFKTFNEVISEKVEDFPEEQTPQKAADMDSLTSSMNDSYRISVTDIFQYFFGGKHSIPSQSATDDNNITNFYIDGNSVPETYDHFFSDFDTENFFCPFITAEDQAKDELVPIFTCSRSASRNLQFPEVYDYLFSSSSSDESSESDDEDKRCPVRVVTRFSRKASTSEVTRDMYEDFFTDSDLRQDFFWKTTFSFRNIHFPGFRVQKQIPANSLSCVPVGQSGRSLRRTYYPSNAVGNQDVMFADPLLHHLEERISRQQALQPFRYEDLQTAVSDPRLEASFLPLRQSDMCLVCIAFASWVLKTANPQVGDAWKAVLLANISALSAIRYLRKYIKSETGASEKRLRNSALP